MNEDQSRRKQSVSGHGLSGAVNHKWRNKMVASRPRDRRDEVAEKRSSTFKVLFHGDRDCCLVRHYLSVFFSLLTLSWLRPLSVRTTTQTLLPSLSTPP